ncbi:MAG TPA: chemotaxis protein CheW [Acidimicrobiia bacterium]
MSDRRYAMFSVDNLTIGVDIDRVQEVLYAETMTPVPLANESVAGILNLRGQIVTVIDARARLGLAPRPVTESAESAPHVVIRSASEAISLVVDRAGDVVDVDEDSLEDVPATVNGTIKNFIRGVHKIDGALLLVLDHDRALSVASS